jgi:IS30 family transposase
MVGWLRMFSIQGFLTWQAKLLMTYKHFSQTESYQIHVLMKSGDDQSHIAKLLDRHKSTISLVLIRNSGSRGLPPQAGLRDFYPSSAKQPKRQLCSTLGERVSQCLVVRVQWSPELCRHKHAGEPSHG